MIVSWFRRMLRAGRLVTLLLLVAGVGGSCRGSQAAGSGDVLRLAFVPTLAQAPALVGIGGGRLGEALAPTRVEATAFDSGKDAAIAMVAGSIDAAYIGPWPTAAMYVRSEGNVAVVSGATAGGASLVVRRGAGIEAPADLHGRRVAVPGVSNTQDIALRSWLADHGLSTQDEGGDVAVVEVGNPELLELFRAGELDVAWVPEPYPTYLVAEGAADVLVDEASLWPDGEFLTTNLVVSHPYLVAHPEVIRRLVGANVDTIRSMQAEPARAQQIARRELAERGAPSLERDVLAGAWDRLSFTWDPLPASMARVADDAYGLGFLDERPSGLAALYRLDALRAVLNDRSLAPIEVELEAA
jgi:NitT/TauT family transport system substrate-binding protein